MSAVLAVDIGGTKFAGAVVHADKTITARAEVPVGADPTATLAALVGRFDLTGVTGVGVGSAGPVHLDLGAVSPVNIPAWRRFPITAVLADLTGGRPVALAGDAQCMALGEHWHGHAPSLLGVVVSTGVGGGLVLDGASYLGRTGNAGHIGHIAVGPDDERCPCGASGCVESFASGPGMVRWAAGLGWTGGTDARALAADAARGVPVARRRSPAAPTPSPPRWSTPRPCSTCTPSSSAAASPPPGRSCSTRSARRWRGGPGSRSCTTSPSCRPPSAATPACTARPRSPSPASLPRFGGDQRRTSRTLRAGLRRGWRRTGRPAAAVTAPSIDEDQYCHAYRG